MPEEDTFAVLVKIMLNYRMREMFKPSMAELGLCMYQLDMLVQEHIPDLSAHFQSQAIHTNLYASSWFLTLFTTVWQIWQFNHVHNHQLKTEHCFHSIPFYSLQLFVKSIWIKIKNSKFRFLEIVSLSFWVSLWDWKPFQPCFDTNWMLWISYINSFTFMH